jgi:dinuclear metal center YbgI/SA1388 family protein
MATDLATLTCYLDDYLRIEDVPDEPNALNGLQVENSGTVRKLAAAVDACQATIDGAVAIGADLLLVHHGLFWGGIEPVTGRHARRLRRLLASDVAVYAAHIPLDCHPEVGNNIVLADMLGLRGVTWFGDYRGIPIGVAGHVNATRDGLIERLRAQLGVQPHVIPTGPAQIDHVGIITGGGGNMIREARDAGVDTYVTGEGAHYTHFDAEEWGLNVIYAGHYATETVGVRALAAHLAEKFDVSWEFVDHPTGL